MRHRRILRDAQGGREIPRPSAWRPEDAGLNGAGNDLGLNCFRSFRREGSTFWLTGWHDRPFPIRVRKAPARAIMLWYDRELAVAPFKRLVNRQEEKAHGELKSVADDYGYVVYLEVRVADVLPIEDSGRNGGEIGSESNK